MAGCTWVDNIAFEPVEAGIMHFTIYSGGEEMRFCISSGMVMPAATDAVSNLSAGGGRVLPFGKS